jgi:REP element-mobilizing transposase RayT
MTRLARMVISGLPHHVTPRGKRREAIFFEDGDQEVYRDLLAEQARKAGIEVWTYCLMPNHVHLILRPEQADGLAARWERHFNVCGQPEGSGESVARLLSAGKRVPGFSRRR